MNPTLGPLSALGFALLASGITNAQAQRNPEAHCLSRFLARVSTLTAYQAHISRKEYRLGRLQVANEIDIIQSRVPRTTELKFVDEGSTGIKNNGMRSLWRGGDTLEIILGKPTGLGFVAHAAASALLSGPISLRSPKLLDGEHFTINHAGLFAAAEILVHHRARVIDEPLKTGKTVFRALAPIDPKRPGVCQLAYEPDPSDQVERVLKPDDDIFAIEREFGTLAYALVAANPDVFSDLNQVFNRRETVRIQIPRGFMGLELSLDDTLATEFRLKLSSRGKLVADYYYTKITPLTLDQVPLVKSAAVQSAPAAAATPAP